MATITLFDMPSEIITYIIYSQLHNVAFLSMRLVSEAARKSITDAMAASYIDTTLNGKVQTNFKGDFKTMGPTFFQYRQRVSTLTAYPELLDILEEVKSEMKKIGYKEPYTVQHFLDYSANTYGVGQGKYLIMTLRQQIEPIWLNLLPLALVPFDLCHPQIRAPNHELLPSDIPVYPKKNEVLPEALLAAAEKNSLELVTLVLSHPQARRLGIWDLDVALSEAKPKDPRIRLAIDNHPSDQRTYATLKRMLRSEQSHSLEEYVAILKKFSIETRWKFYKHLCNKYGSPTNNIVNDGLDHFRKNPKQYLKYLAQV